MAEHRHKRETNARLKLRQLKAVRIAGPLALMATASAVTLGTLAVDPETPDLLAAPPTASLGTASDALDDSRGLGSVSRDFSRTAKPAKAERPEKPQPPTELEKLLSKDAVRKAVAGATERLWTTELLNIWTQPGDAAREVSEIDAGKKVLVTGRTFLGRDEIVLDGASRWVTAGYLSADKPVEEVGLGGECTNGSSVPSGVSPNIVKVHAAVCAAFPELTSYGTFRSDGEHGQGLAIDIMVSGSRGQEVADFVRENYAELGVNYLIYSQQIWSVDRSGEGYRYMSDRGSTTANHYDHVHVTTY